VLLAALAFVPVPVCAEQTPLSTSGQILFSEGSTIAKKAFEKHTHRKIKKVHMKLSKETNDEWYFYFEGEEEYFRPGYHWFVIVNKRTGKTTILDGE
jgi:hypothetical protein